MPKVFKTPDDYTDTIEVVGAGVAGPEGRGGVPVEVAAETMSELQNDKGEALSGKKLDEAAKSFAERRGLVVASVAEGKIDSLPQEWGVAADRPPAIEVAVEDHRRTSGEQAPDLEAAAEETMPAEPEQPTSEEE